MLQLTYFASDVKRMLGKHKVRIVYVWLSRSFWGILQYRLERSLFLVLVGKSYSFVRVPFVPLLNLIHAYFNIGIHYKADINKGTFVIGNQCSLGANATVIGPVILGDNITVGASACVVKSCLTSQSVLIGVPAKIQNKD